MKLRHTKKLALVGVAFGALMMNQGAANADTASEIRALKERLKQLEAQVAAQKKVKAAAVPMTAKGETQPPVWVSFGPGLKVESFTEGKDGNYERGKDFWVKFGGRIFVDGGIASEPLTGQSGNVGIRRARLEAEGLAFKYWLYKMQYDFTSDGIGGIRDAYLAFKHPGTAILPFTSAPLVIQIGNQKEPFALEELTSSKYISFIERALPVDTFSPSRHIGISVGTHGDNWTAKVGVYATSPQNAAQQPSPATPREVVGGAPTGGRQYMDIAGRLTYAPVMEKDALIHLGGGFRFQSPNSATGATEGSPLILGTNVRSEANQLRINLLGTPDLSCGVLPGFGAAGLGGGQAGECVKSLITWNAELAAAYGPFSVQGEYFGSQYNRSQAALNYATAAGAGVNASGSSSLAFSGFYVYGTWFLTGESRAESYEVKGLQGAEFGRIHIRNPLSKGGIGAWEIGGRYSEVNLNDGGIQGGRQQDFTLGLNWYPDRGVRFMANWIHVAHISAPYNRPWVNGANPDIFLMRAQVDW
jgi:phosphate-selective porin OprO/OprP